MVVSFPETIGQLTGSEVVGADPGQSDRSTGEVCMGFRDEEEEERLLERLMESLTVTRCLRIKLDT